jgi:hypothetical protein
MDDLAPSQAEFHETDFHDDIRATDVRPLCDRNPIIRRCARQVL